MTGMGVDPGGSIAVPRMPAIAKGFRMFVTSSTVLSVVFDHFGWLGISEHPASIGRVAGCALMVLGIGLVSVFQPAGTGGT